MLTSPRPSRQSLVIDMLRAPRVLSGPYPTRGSHYRHSAFHIRRASVSREMNCLMSGPSRLSLPVLWPLPPSPGSARRRRSCRRTRGRLRSAGCSDGRREISPGKDNDLPLIYPSRLRPSAHAVLDFALPCRLVRSGTPDAISVRRAEGLPPAPFSWASRLSPCHRLTVPVAKSVEDFHLKVIAHAGHARRGSRLLAKPPASLLRVVMPAAENGWNI
jgi:hypothetical protein